MVRIVGEIRRVGLRRIGSRGARLPFEAPPVAVALVVHAVAHVVLGGAGGNALQKKTIRRLLSKDRIRTHYNHEHAFDASSTTSVREYFGENERWRVARDVIWLGLLFWKVW